MPTALPAKTILNGADNPTTAQMKTALGQLHDRLSESIPDGRLIAEAGTAAAPSLTTTGDTNTGVYFPAADTVAIATGGVKRVEVDANGNVGVGITPSDWGTYNKVLQVRNAALSNNDTIDAILSLSNNCYRDNASGWKYNNSGYAATLYQQGFTDSGHYWYTAPSGTAGNAITFTQAMTLDASGNLGLGTTTPSPYRFNVLRADGNAAFFTDGSTADLYIKCISGVTTLSPTTGVLAFGTSSTERARITSEGNLLVGTTSATDPNIKMEVVNSGIAGCYLANNPTSAETNHTLFAGKAIGVDRFWVLGNGNVANQNNSYGGISDAKLKENIVDTAPKLDSLLKVRIVNYNLKTDPQFKQIGVIAQELEQIFPSMIEEMPDRDDEGNDLGTVTKSVKYSAFVPMLIKAIQEQQALIESQKIAIESLTARITALEAK